MKEKANKYCRQCGQELLRYVREVRHIEKNYYVGDWGKLGSAFNPHTGKLNRVEIHVCPNYKRKWYGRDYHDIFCVYKESIEWGIREVWNYRVK